MAKIYTKTGDDGMTGLLSSRRVFKNDARIEAYGTVDELNAALGIVRSMGLDPESDQIAAGIQNDLFCLGSALADPNPSGPFQSMIRLEHIQNLERRIDAMDAELPKLTQFILPGGDPAAARMHLARAICRRAERMVVGLKREPHESVPDSVVIYLNRLSDLLFTWARLLNHRAGLGDVPWTQS